MTDAPFPYQFIAIEGNIGTAKQRCAIGCKKCTPATWCWSNLQTIRSFPVFYKNPERYAFPVELFFMTERHKQLQEHFAEPDLFSSFTVSDYFFLKTLLFAKKNLNDEENRLFQRLFKVLNASFPNPDILIYLHRPVDVLLKQIEKRGRSMEDYITAEYLEGVQTAYFEFFKSDPPFPVLVVDLGELDYVEKPELLGTLFELLKTTHETGVKHIKLQV